MKQVKAQTTILFVGLNFSLIRASTQFDILTNEAKCLKSGWAQTTSIFKKLKSEHHITELDSILI